MKTILLLLVLILTFNSCKKCDCPNIETSFTQEELLFLPDETNGDSIVFTTDISQDKKVFFIEKNDDVEIGQSISLGIPRCNCQDYALVYGTVNYYFLNNEFQFIISIFKRSIPEIDFKKEFIINNKNVEVTDTLDTLILNGKEYKDVNIIYPDADPSFSKLYFTYSEGLIKITDTDGVSWIRN